MPTPDTALPHSTMAEGSTESSTPTRSFIDLNCISDIMGASSPPSTMASASSSSSSTPSHRRASTGPTVMDSSFVRQRSYYGGEDPGASYFTPRKGSATPDEAMGRALSPINNLASTNSPRNEIATPKRALISPTLRDSPTTVNSSDGKSDGGSTGRRHSDVSKRLPPMIPPVPSLISPDQSTIKRKRSRGSLLAQKLKNKVPISRGNNNASPDSGHAKQNSRASGVPVGQKPLTRGHDDAVANETPTKPPAGTAMDQAGLPIDVLQDDSDTHSEYSRLSFRSTSSASSHTNVPRHEMTRSGSFASLQAEKRKSESKAGRSGASGGNEGLISLIRSLTLTSTTRRTAVGEKTAGANFQLSDSRSVDTSTDVSSSMRRTSSSSSGGIDSVNANNGAASTHGGGQEQQNIREEKYMTLEHELHRFRVLASDADRIAMLRDFLLPYLRTAPSHTSNIPSSASAVSSATVDSTDGPATGSFSCEAAERGNNSKSKSGTAAKRSSYMLRGLMESAARGAAVSPSSMGGISKDDRISRIYGFGSSPSAMRSSTASSNLVTNAPAAGSPNTPYRASLSSPDLTKTFIASLSSPSLLMLSDRPHSPQHDGSTAGERMSPTQIVCREGGLDESDEIILQVLLKWWAATVSMILPGALPGTETSSLRSGSDSERTLRTAPTSGLMLKLADRSVVFDVLGRLASLRVWSTHLHSSKGTKGMTSGSDCSTPPPASSSIIAQRFQSLVALSLHYGITQIVENCPVNRPLSRITVLFIARMLAVAMFSVPDVARAICVILQTPHDSRGRFMRQFGIDVPKLRQLAPGTRETFESIFPDFLLENIEDGMIIESRNRVRGGRVSVRLSPSMKMEIASLEACEEDWPLLEIDFSGAVRHRLLSHTAELLFPLIRFWHDTLGHYVATAASRQSATSAPIVLKFRECFHIPGWVAIYAQQFHMLETLVHRHDLIPFSGVMPGPHGIQLGPRFSNFGAHTTFETATKMLIDACANVATHLWGEWHDFFVLVLGNMLSATARGVRVSDLHGCFALCDVSSHILLFLFDYHSFEIDRTLWKQVMLGLFESRNDFLALRAIGFMYDLWPELDVKTKREWGEWIVNDLFDPLFMHWGPMVRTHFMRLLCWKVIRPVTLNPESDEEVFDGARELGPVVRERLVQAWNAHQELLIEACQSGREPPSILPCNPIPNRKFTILPIFSALPAASASISVYAARSGDPEAMVTPPPSALEEAMGADAEEDDMISNTQTADIGFSGNFIRGIMRLRNTLVSDSFSPTLSFSPSSQASSDGNGSGSTGSESHFFQASYRGIPEARYSARPTQQQPSNMRLLPPSSHNARPASFTEERRNSYPLPREGHSPRGGEAAATTAGKTLGYRFAFENCKQRRPSDFTYPPAKYVQLMDRSATGILPRNVEEVLAKVDGSERAHAPRSHARTASSSSFTAQSVTDRRQYAGRSLAEWAHVVLEYDSFHNHRMAAARRPVKTLGDLGPADARTNTPPAPHARQNPRAESIQSGGPDEFDQMDAPLLQIEWPRFLNHPRYTTERV